MMLPTLTVDDLVLLLEVDRARRAELLARLAGAPLEVGAVLRVDHRVLGHGLRERAVDRLAVAQARLEDVVHDLLRALLLAQAAAGAQVGVDLARLLADRAR